MLLPDKTDEPSRPDEAILAHVELYRLTILPAVAKLFFSTGGATNDIGKQRAGDVLAALVRQGRLQARRFPKAPGTDAGESYFVLPPIKSSKQRPADPQSLNFDLQTLWLCTLSSDRFYRLSLQEIRQLFTTPPHHHVRHVIGEEGDGPSVSRIYPSSVDVKSTIVNLKKFMNEARTKYGLGPWIDAGDYGFYILADNHRKITDIGEAVMSNRQGAGPLADQARIQVGFAPTSVTVSQAIRAC